MDWVDRWKARGLILFIIVLIAWSSPGFGEMYKWVDEKGTVHFADDLSKIPEKFRPDVKSQKTPKESASPGKRTTSAPSPDTKASEPEGFEVNLFRRNELWLAEVVLNERVSRYFIIDSGASFTLINRETATDLGIIIDENTPFTPIITVSDRILVPLVTLKSVRVGEVKAENVMALIYDIPTGIDGLLGNSFLNQFRVVLDSANEKMTLFSSRGKPSPDRPGGYSRDFWVGQFRFYHQSLAELKKLKATYENQRATSDLNRVNNAIRYFENQLGELERRASFAGVPRNWRE